LREWRWWVHPSSEISESKGARHHYWWHHMTPAQLRRIRTRLLAFAQDIFASIPRKEALP